MNFSVKNRSLTKNDFLYVVGFSNLPSRNEVLKKHTELEKSLAKEALFYRLWLEKFYHMYCEKEPHIDIVVAFDRMFNGENL